MKKNNKGFTLAELLIVVAIIAVLVAIAIPIFTTQLEKAREATDLANVRSAYGQAVSEYLGNGGQPVSIQVKAQQTIAKWQSAGEAAETSIGVDMTVTAGSGSGTVAVKVPANANSTYTLEIDASGSITVK